MRCAIPTLRENADGLTRRRFLEVAATGATVAAVTGGIAGGTSVEREATLAVLSDAALDLRGGREGGLDALRRAVQAAASGAGKPDAILFLGGLSACGDPEAIERGAEALHAAGRPVLALPGAEERGAPARAAWRRAFDPVPEESTLGGTLLLLPDVGDLVPHPGSGDAMPAEQLRGRGGLASRWRGRFALDAAATDRWRRRLDALAPDEPVILATYAPLLNLHRPWNWGVDGGARVLEAFAAADRGCHLFGLTGCAASVPWGPGRVAFGVPAAVGARRMPKALAGLEGVRQWTRERVPTAALARLGPTRAPSVSYLSA